MSVYGFQEQLQAFDNLEQEFNEIRRPTLRDGLRFRERLKPIELMATQFFSQTSEVNQLLENFKPHAEECGYWEVIAPSTEDKDSDKVVELFHKRVMAFVTKLDQKIRCLTSVQ